MKRAGVAAQEIRRNESMKDPASRFFCGCFDRGGAGFENVIDCAIAARFAHEGPVLAA